MQKEKIKEFNGKVYSVDTSPETMKKVRERFKDIENIEIPISGAKLLAKIRKEHKIVSL